MFSLRLQGSFYFPKEPITHRVLQNNEGHFSIYNQWFLSLLSKEDKDTTASNIFHLEKSADVLYRRPPSRSLKGK